ncbi:MAG TPA: TetR/AcrR family transcriptional regulator C-terminal domain-containing protein [Aggregatilineales bacterium]|nr:TetR/AcrR family transcriptional regulator C-terminal domain-containing protein [Aggregatilineales bacterium]
MARVRIRLQAKLDVKLTAKAALDPGQIVQAALNLLDEVGLDGLTMRRLAEKLDIKAASLYWHVRDKDELIVLLADEICAAMQAPDPAMPWREQLQQFAEEYRRVLLSHRDAARVLAQSGPPSGESRLNLVEILLDVVLKAGFSPKDAAYAGFLMNDYVTTFVIEETRYVAPPKGQQPPDEATESWMDTLPADKYPNIVALAPHWLNVNLDEQFHFGCEVIADGLERRLNR